MNTQERKALFFYVLECLAGGVIGYFLYTLNPTIGAWCMFSIMLVLSPDRKDAMGLALNRIKANLIGAATGLALFFIHPVNLLMICIGIAVTVVTCELLKLKAATRSAVVSVMIIMLHEPGKYFWDVALERAGGVLAGCLIGVGLTYVFHLVMSGAKLALQKEKEESGE